MISDAFTSLRAHRTFQLLLKLNTLSVGVDYVRASEKGRISVKDFKVKIFLSLLVEDPINKYKKINKINSLIQNDFKRSLRIHPVLPIWQLNDRTHRLSARIECVNVN